MSQLPCQDRSYGSHSERKPAQFWGQWINPKKDLRQFLSVLRLPLLSVHPTFEDCHYEGFEQGSKVRLTVSRRYKNCGRALASDSFVLSYIASAAVPVVNRCGMSIPELSVEPRATLKKLGLPADEEHCHEVVQSLRRLTTTVIDLRNWGPRKVNDQFPLLDIWPNSDSTSYSVELSDWLRDEVQANRIIRMPPESLKLGGLQNRLYGWAKGWVGRKEGEGRIIRQREALARAGPFPPGRSPWEEILEAVAADNVPDFEFTPVTFEGQPAIAVTRRSYRTPDAEDAEPGLIIDLSDGTSQPTPDPSPMSEIVLYAEDSNDRTPDADPTEIDLVPPLEVWL